jgi:hypothetical protein
VQFTEDGKLTEQIRMNRSSTRLLPGCTGIKYRNLMLAFSELKRQKGAGQTAANNRDTHVSPLFDGVFGSQDWFWVEDYNA